MIQKRKIIRSTQKQLAKLLDYMSNSREFANGNYIGPMGKKQFIQEWEVLRKLLNEDGPAKTLEQWKNTWRDLKKRAREEYANMKRARTGTGNLPVPELSPQSALIINIIGMEAGVGEMVKPVSEEDSAGAQVEELDFLYEAVVVPQHSVDEQMLHAAASSTQPRPAFIPVPAPAPDPEPAAEIPQDCRSKKELEISKEAARLALAEAAQIRARAATKKAEAAMRSAAALEIMAQSVAGMQATLQRLERTINAALPRPAVEDFIENVYK